MAPEKSKINIGLMCCKADSESQHIARRIQESAVVNMVERLLNTFQAEEFVRVMDALVHMECFPISKEDHAFTGAAGNREGCFSGWTKQTVFDLTFAVVGSQVLQRSCKEGEKARDIELATAVSRVVENKQKVSLRLRVFRALRKKEQHLGNMLWNMMDDMLKERLDQDAVAGDIYEFGRNEGKK